ncbi:MAG: hypothetical protein DRJ35_04400 [Thermoprotei archaeon]|nr:MAG: hypothetical protein DRJ35_04400 [Thermoprotei archaeon]
MKENETEKDNTVSFTDAFFNVYEEDKKVCIESDCENISSLREHYGIGEEFQSLGDICRVCASQYTVEETVQFLENIGVKRSRIAVDNVPIEVDVDTVFSKKSIVLACPRCGSTDITVINIAGLLPPMYRCLKCGYIGRIILEIEVEKD